MISKRQSMLFIALLNFVWLFGQSSDYKTKYYGELDFTPVEGQSGSFIEERREVSDLPFEVDLADKFPPAGNQGFISSCWAWATTYAFMTYFENNLSNDNIYGPNNSGNFDEVFSPAYTYHRYKKTGDNSCNSLHRSYEVLKEILKDGAVSYNLMRFEGEDCNITPDPQLSEVAKSNALSDYYVAMTHNLYTIKERTEAMMFH